MKKIVNLILLGVVGLSVCAQTSADASSSIRKIPSLYSIVISLKDTIRYDQHFNGTKDRDVFDDQSLTKSIGSLLIGIAIDKGLISGPDEKLTHWFPELEKDTDRRKQDITLRQVMNQASGLWHENLESPTGIPDFMALSDPGGFVLQSPLVSAPGTILHYNNAASHLLSLILARSCGTDVRTFAVKNLFGPLGITTLEWKKIRDGSYDLAGLQPVRLRTADLIKIGSLLLHEGRYGGQQVVSKAWISQLLQPDIHYPAPWGFPSSQYALCWYHTTFKGNQVIYGMGWGGQFLIVVPALQMVMSINQSHEDDKAVIQSGRFIESIFPGFYDAVETGKIK